VRRVSRRMLLMEMCSNLMDAEWTQTESVKES
jgi:hypothetical protein